MNIHHLKLAGNPAERQKPRATATIDDDGAIVIRIEAPASVLAPDELVNVYELGLERRAVATLIARGVLRVAKIGRRYFARRSDLLAAFDKLVEAAPKTPAQASNDSKADYFALVSSAGRRHK